VLIANPFANGGEGEVGMYNINGTQEQTFNSAYLNDQIGNAMATDGSHILLSSASPNGTVVQEFNPTSSTAIRELSLPSPQQPFTLALAYGAGGKVIVGDANGGDVAYVFASYATNPANNQSPLLTIQGNSGTLFGLGIAVRGNDLVVGAEIEGKAYVFDYTQTGSITVANATQTLTSPVNTGPDFGAAVAATTNGFVIADPYANSFAGELYLFEAPTGPTTPTAVLVSGDLIVTGTDSAETIVVRRVNGSLPRVFVNNVQLGGDFAVTGKIVINGGGGDDNLSSDLSNTFTTEIYGGAGNDTITGGGGNDFLFGEGDNDVITARQGNDVAVGGDGNDVMTGGQGRDVLIGGDGADQVEGDQGDDILVAGITTHDTDVAALTSIRTTWLSGSDYATRVNTLRNGLLDNNTSVFDDGDADTVTGGTGQDWFLVQTDGTGTLDTLVDIKKSELASDIDP
jgi:Ca2+-binding RTX toxin-like protein